ncbi:MAG: hypothetical protein LJE91_16710 [Gammaproteobacteria bacterium]|jgi:hypothetical protein|nr:hypothetical protein [Gammaproteobacteria bacterium]
MTDGRWREQGLWQKNGLTAERLLGYVVPFLVVLVAVVVALESAHPGP